MLERFAEVRFEGLPSRAFGQDSGCNSALGCLLGLAVGDAVGAPLEFCAVDENQDSDDSANKLSRCFSAAIQPFSYWVSSFLCCCTLACSSLCASFLASCHVFEC